MKKDPGFYRLAILGLVALVLAVSYMRGFFASPGDAEEYDITEEAPAPVVIFAEPSDRSQAVSRNTGIQVTFSGAMDPSTVNDLSFLVDGQTGGTISYDDHSRTATFRPSALLEPDTTYRVMITRKVTDVSGNPLASAFSWQFRTGESLDNAPPDVYSYFPYVEAAVDPSMPLIVRAWFSEPMDASTLHSLSFLIDDSATGTVTYNAASREARLTIPGGAYQTGKTYTAKITAETRDLSGNSLTADFFWSFSVQTADPDDPFDEGLTPGSSNGCFLTVASWQSIKRSSEPYHFAAPVGIQR